MKMKNQTPRVTVPSRSLGRKALPKILLALTAVAALSVAYPAKANLITNPGFESGNFNGWGTLGPPTPCVTGTFFGVAPHSGFRGEGSLRGFSLSVRCDDTGHVLHH